MPKAKPKPKMPAVGPPKCEICEKKIKVQGQVWTVNCSNGPQDPENKSPCLGFICHEACFEKLIWRVAKRIKRGGFKDKNGNISSHRDAWKGCKIKLIINGMTREGGGAHGELKILYCPTCNLKGRMIGPWPPGLFD